MRRRWPAAALAVLVLLLAGLVVRVLLLERADREAVEAATRTDRAAPVERMLVSAPGVKTAGMLAATDAVERVLSYSAATLDDDIQAAHRRLAPARWAEYARSMRAVLDETRRNDTSVDATVVAASVVVATSRDVSALLFVDQVTRGNHLDRPRVERNRVLVTLRRDTGRWLVTGLTAV
jgi:Mce-associated membrane protein